MKNASMPAAVALLTDVRPVRETEVEWMATTKVKISALWVSAMMCYIYADLIGFLPPGHLQRILDGYMGWWKTTPALLLGSAIVMSIPIVMIFLTVVLRSSVNRWLNVVLGALHVLFAFVLILGALAPRLYYYIYFGAVEMVLSGLIVWYAVTWPKHLDPAQTLAAE